MTRLWPNGQEISVIIDSQKEDQIAGAPPREPKSFTWQSQSHRVIKITRVWRVDIDWWRDRVWRTFYKLHTDTGLLVVIYQNQIDGQWFLQRLYD